MSAPQFDKRVWGSPNPARWRARRQEEAPASAPAEAHGHQEHACYHCPSPSNCDCPCATCIRCRRMRAGTACVACGSYEGLPAEREAGVVVECARCVAAAEEDSHSTGSDGGALCPGCDGYLQCVCHEPGDDREEEDRHTELGDCPGCFPGCYGCDPHFDPSDPWGDGAPEEHPGHPGYNGGYDSD